MSIQAQAAQDHINPPHGLWKSQTVIKGEYAPNACANYHCQNPSGFMDTPFCDDCIWRLWADMDMTLPNEKKELARQGRFDAIHEMTARATAAEEQRERAWAERERHTFMTQPGTIYYLRVGDLIKIGFTSYMEDRMRSYPPNAELLAQHPGTRETERQMHHRFLHRVAKGREWFTPCDEIDLHITQVREKFQPQEP